MQPYCFCYDLSAYVQCCPSGVCDTFCVPWVYCVVNVCDVSAFCLPICLRILAAALQWKDRCHRGKVPRGSQQAPRAQHRHEEDGAWHLSDLVLHTTPEPVRWHLASTMTWYCTPRCSVHDPPTLVFADNGMY